MAIEWSRHHDVPASSPVVARLWCPGCEPGADPIREVLDTRWCETHGPSRAGLDDERVDTEAVLSGSVEAGGDDNRRWCQLLHGEPGRRRRGRRG